MLQHPDVTFMRLKGFVPYSDLRREYGTDPLGNEVMTGDNILVINDEFFLVDELFQETIEALEVVGATHEIAK